jgi:hypothetical protein
MNQGQKRRERGIARVTYSNSEFVSVMREYIIAKARRGGTVNADHVREIASRRGIEPTHPNAYGAVFRCPEFKPVGYTHSKAPSRHAGVIRVWELAK